ncbi:MAG TPA: ArsC/Spx/MgsR family protein [Candidatus Limnocylindria bacterium]|nr:ArsC/Spx/MgsR family protein [Candidatus Limnocylindria bacterium]
MSPAAKPAGPLVQVFGTPDSQPTRAAMRFFKERRMEIHFVDIGRKPMAAGELRRFVDRLGARALADTDGKTWRDAGLGYLSMTDADLAARLLDDQRLLKIPLVRVDNAFAAGKDDAAWKTLLSLRGAAPHG